LAAGEFRRFFERVASYLAHFIDWLGSNDGRMT